MGEALREKEARFFRELKAAVERSKQIPRSCLA